MLGIAKTAVLYKTIHILTNLPAVQHLHLSVCKWLYCRLQIHKQSEQVSVHLKLKFVKIEN